MIYYKRINFGFFKLLHISLLVNDVIDMQKLTMNDENSFLKNLEEPSKNTFIFLISHQLSSLIPTIRSRCLKIKLTKHNFVNFKNIIFII